MNYHHMKEKIPHGNATFPFMIHSIVTDESLIERLNWHWHNELEIFVVTEGEAEFHLNEQIYHVRKHDVLFINSNSLHSATGINNLPFDFFAVVFHPFLLDSSSNDDIQQKYLTPVYHKQILFQELLTSDTEWRNEVLHLLYEIKNLFEESSPGYELIIKAKLVTLWYVYLKHSEQPASVESKVNDYRILRIKTVLSYIQQHYQNKITLQDLAKITGLSEGQFCRFFKWMAKMPALEYINYYRINQSLSLLTDTDKSISEIASLCGFNNISYFNKVFLKFMHKTPSLYRKSMTRE